MSPPQLPEMAATLETPEVGPPPIPPAKNGELGTKTKHSRNPELANSVDEDEQEGSGLGNVSGTSLLVEWPV